MFLVVVLDHLAEHREILRGQALGDGVTELGHALGVDVVDTGKLHLRKRLTRRLLDGLEQMTLTRSDEQQRVTLTTGAAGTTDAVNVRLRVMRDVVVDDVGDSIDVEASSGNVGRDKDVEGAVLELTDGPLTLCLDDVAVDRGGRVPAGPAASPPGLRWPAWYGRR